MAYQFNPIKQDESGKKAKRVIWSTSAIELAIQGLSQGRELIANPFYERDIRLLKGDLNYQRTEQEIEEWIKCKNDIIYFAEHYCKLMTPLGIRKVDLRDYQKRYLRHVTENQLSIYLACRQCGKTTTTAVALLHYICFNVEKNALVCGNKRKTAVEIIDKIQKIFYELPFFIKPGVYKWNQTEIAFDNGCRVQGEATTNNAGIGFTIHWLLLDEFAHIAKNIAEPFYNNIFPTVSAAKAKVTITSTQNGRNLFYRLYKGAEEGVSDYKAFKTDWYEVPEWDANQKKFVPRDEAWYNKQIANFGSVEAFNSQFGCDFDISSDGLINNRILKKIQAKTHTFIPGGGNEILLEKLSEYWFFDDNFISEYTVKKPDLNIIDLFKNLPLLLTIDISEGVGKDYTCFAIHTFDYLNGESGNQKESGKYKMRLIGYYRCNSKSRPDQVKELIKFLTTFCNYDHTLVSIEYNTYGELFYQEILKQTEEHMDFDRNVIIKYYVDPQNPKKWHPGIRLNSRNKPLACNLFKESFEEGKYDSSGCEVLLNELANFIKNPNNDSYAASFGHDDLVMCAIQTELTKNTTQYKMLISELDGVLYKLETWFNNLTGNIFSINPNGNGIPGGAPGNLEIQMYNSIPVGNQNLGNPFFKSAYGSFDPGNVYGMENQQGGSLYDF